MGQQRALSAAAVAAAAVWVISRIRQRRWRCYADGYIDAMHHIHARAYGAGSISTSYTKR